MLPAELVKLWTSPPKGLGALLYSPTAASHERMSLDAALEALQSSAHPVRRGLVPVTYVDDRSLACVVCRPTGDSPIAGEGHVIRWHLDDIPDDHQAAVLDVDVWQYAESLVEGASRSWQTGYDGVTKAADRFQRNFVEKGVTPKAHDLRPFQLACQNVIVGLAAMRHDAIIDGLSVEYWQTCEVPHVATNEGNRALTALMLCDAFQAGGTMEIDFGTHPEHRVPAVLRRYGRTLGLELGAEIPGGASISPTEARELFLSVTPMTDGLRDAAQEAMRLGLVSAERLCFSLLSPIWPAIELEFILRCSPRAGTILEGGTDVEQRDARLAELEIARAATMAGTLLRRINSKDGAGGTGDPHAVRVFEDSSYGVTWRVIGDYAAVELEGLPPGPIPWQPPGAPAVEPVGSRLIVLPRPHPMVDDREALEAVRSDVPAVLVIPRGAHAPADEPFLICPDRLSEIDARVDRNLHTSRVIRA